MCRHARGIELDATALGDTAVAAVPDWCLTKGTSAEAPHRGALASDRAEPRLLGRPEVRGADKYATFT